MTIVGRVSHGQSGAVRIDAVDTIHSIKAVILDGDGVLTDNRVLEGLEEAKPRFRSHYDGQGVSLLRAIGIKVCIITNESGVAAQAIQGLVDRWNSLPSTPQWGEVGIFLGRAGEKKVGAAESWLASRNLSWRECAVMGDDLVDVPMLRKAAFKAAPSSAEYVVRDIVDFVSNRPGGRGAVRDFANLILEVRGIDPTTLPTQ